MTIILCITGINSYTPPIIFERLKLPPQIIYRRKENLSESLHHSKYGKIF